MQMHNPTPWLSANRKILVIKTGTPLEKTESSIIPDTGQTPGGIAAGGIPWIARVSYAADIEPLSIRLGESSFVSHWISRVAVRPASRVVGKTRPDSHGSCLKRASKPVWSARKTAEVDCVVRNVKSVAT